MGSSLERKQYIRTQLEQFHTVQVGELARALGVSEMTIRRDLNDLERVGVLRKTHGGAERELSCSYEPPFGVRSHEALAQKQIIASEAVRFVHEGDTIAIDSGTTTVEFARQLTSFKNLTIVTTSIHIALMFLDHPSITVILSGGTLRRHEGSLVGSLAWESFSRLHFDTFFVSVAAVNAEVGLSDYIIEDADIKRMIISHTNRTVALIHAEKFDHTAFAQVAPLEDIDVLITDSQPTAGLQQELNSNHVRTIIARVKEF